MSKNKIYQGIEQFVVSRLSQSRLFAEYYKRTENKATYKPQATAYEAKAIKDWKMAIMTATDPENPRRGELMRFYQSLRLDNHLSSVIDTRILRVQRSSFKILNEKGEENEELKALLERPWYEDLVRLVLLKNFQGTTLIEMFDTDSNGELERVSEIPQANFIATKGIVVNEEWDTTGTSYKEGRLADYYLQVGNDYELGMLNELAMIVLAKKLGLGSWMSYIQKFGVPPIFVTTERYDETRTSELFSMLSDFRSNHFAILQGAEKVEMPNNNNLDGYKSFQSLNSFADAQISKRVLGGTATTDDKSFVGAAEVQERVAQDRYEADKLLFKYYFNTHVRHRLAKLSSVYTDFNTHTIDWDNQESLDIKDYIDGVQKLAGTFEFDIDEIKARTGLPIIGTKQSTTTEPTTEKKKTEPSAVGLQYAPFAINTANIQAATWDAAIERLANQIYNGETKAQDLDRDLVLKNYAAFNKAAEAGYGAGYYEKPIGQTMRNNILRYSGAKTYNLMQRLETLKADSKDKADFTTKAKQLVQMHNDTWLDTEKQFVSRSAEAVREWEQFQEDKDLYPNLTYRTMGDEDVRDSHQKMEGITKPVDDPYWLIYTPPNGDRCRCRLEQTMSTPTPDKNTPKITIDERFAHNPGMKGEIFTPKNTYEQSVQQKHFNKTRENTELHKQFIPYSRTIKTKTATVYVNDFADLADLEENIQAAKRIAEATQKDIYVRHHIDGGVVQNHKNPELGLGTKNKVGDLKTYDGDTLLYNFTQNAVKSANKQRAEFIVLEVSKATDYKLLKRALKGSLNNRNRNIKKVFVLSENAVFSLTRTQIMKNNFDKL